MILQTISIALLLFLLCIVIWQDFNYHAVSWLVFPAMFLLLAVPRIYSSGFSNWGYDTLVNSFLIIIQLALVTIYFTIKQRKLVAITSGMIGWGDILFFLVIAQAFSPINFLLFYILTLFFIVLVFLSYNLKRGSGKEIPLAGAMAIVLLAAQALRLCFPFLDFYNDGFVTGILME